MIQKVARQMEKLIDVLKVFVHTSDQIIYQEIALFKVSTSGLMSGNIIDEIVRTYNVRILEVSPEYMVIEKTGRRSEINELLVHLEPYGLLQFAKSGRDVIRRKLEQ